MPAPGAHQGKCSTVKVLLLFENILGANLKTRVAERHRAVAPQKRLSQTERPPLRWQDELGVYFARALVHMLFLK